MLYVFITGATGVLGRCYAFDQANKGENLILTGRSIDKLNNLKTELLKVNQNIDIQIFPCNLADSSNRQKMFNQITEGNFNIYRLINVAGVDTQMAFDNYTEEKLIFQIRVNLEACISLTRFVLSNKISKLEILTVSSLCGVTPMPYFAIYSATKSALINFFDGIRYEYPKNQVKITTLMPGSIPTRIDIIEDIKKQGLQGKLSQMSPELVVKKSLKALAKNKPRYVPGLYNKIVYFFSKITPYTLTSKIIKRKFSVKQKDAF